MKKSSKKFLRIFLLGDPGNETTKLKELLHSITDCEVQVIESVRVALMLLTRKMPDLIITEEQLRDLTAVELIKALKSRSEWANIKIACLAGVRRKIGMSTSELETPEKDTGADEILYKPIERKILEEMLNRLFFSQDKMKEPEEISEVLKEQIKNIDRLTPLPTLAHDIIEITHDPNSNARDLAEIISKDQTLTARLLKIVNSAYFNFYRKIGDISRAIVVLGIEEVRNISLATCLMKNFPATENPYFDREAYWRHAFGTAYIAKSISHLCRKLVPEDAFTMGLLHDFGKVVLDQHFGKIFEEMLSSAVEEKRPLYQISRERINIDHAEIGGIITEKWKFPPVIVDGIKFHHEPFKCLSGDHAYVIHLANYFCHLHKIGASGNPVANVIHPTALISLGIEESQLDEIWNTTKIKAESLSTLI